ncbi:hypothetical protein CEXT_437661 [Caerostris extrusa]|uniref:Uncharacterized protein n=1 Tax=Caerostris extrusa TaxID=172846 RepID=A0AAV4XIV9_CAEEX|nr:hypothetical protein CEXT_437661 [Caerostris extrusa]
MRVLFYLGLPCFPDHCQPLDSGVPRNRLTDSGILLITNWFIVTIPMLRSFISVHFVVTENYLESSGGRLFPIDFIAVQSCSDPNTNNEIPILAVLP